jgi:hypothetical protein
MKPSKKKNIARARRARRTPVEGRSGLPHGSGVGPFGVEGALAGAAAGAFAGPVGMVAGGVIGGLIGAVVDEVTHEEEVRHSRHDAELDEAIGVTGPGIGAAKPDQPPARFGAYSSASSGVGGSSTETVSSGPIQDVDEQ